MIAGFGALGASAHLVHRTRRSWRWTSCSSSARRAPDQVAALARDRAAGLAPAAIATVVDSCDGLPLLVEEFAAALDRSDATDATAVPPMLAELTGRRLDRLPASAREVVHVAALLGEPDGELLCVLGTFDEDAVARAPRAAVDAALLVSDRTAPGGVRCRRTLAIDADRARPGRAGGPVRDSHTRFYGGLYVAVGLFLLLAATRPERFRVGLHLVFAMIFAGGLARLTVLRPDVILDADLMLSIGVELVVMPLLSLWLVLVFRASEPGPARTAARRAQRFAAVCE